MFNRHDIARVLLNGFVYRSKTPALFSHQPKSSRPRRLDCLVQYSLPSSSNIWYRLAMSAIVMRQRVVHAEEEQLDMHRIKE